MPYQPERAWCDDCGVRVPISNVGFNKEGRVEKPILCVTCYAQRSADRIRDRSRDVRSHARSAHKGHPTHD